jgi:hypothetical protein
MADLTIGDVDEIREFLVGTCEELTTWLPGTGWEPGWKSEAAAELANAEQRQDGSAWGDAPVRTAYAAAAVYMFSIQDCLRAIASSVNLLTTMYVPSVLARAAMEAGAQAWWLLEPGIGPRRRVIRTLLVRASGARNLGEAVRKADPGGTVSEYGEDQDALRAYAHSLGLAYICNDDRTECETEVLPGYNSRARDLEAAMQMIAAYKIYSGAAHAEWHSVVQGWRRVTSPASSVPLWGGSGRGCRGRGSGGLRSIRRAARPGQRRRGG